MRLLLAILLALAGVLLAAGPAQAYLDPGSGSMLLQIILGGLAGLVVLVKLYWARLRAWLQSRRGAARRSSKPPARP